jgi:hypothetical protein
MFTFKILTIFCAKTGYFANVTVTSQTFGLAACLIDFGLFVSVPRSLNSAWHFRQVFETKMEN